MMRKVKFQEGGNVEMTAAERRRQNIQRINERRAANRAQAASNAEDARFNERMRRGTLTAEDMRRMGAEPTQRQPAAPSMRDAGRPVEPRQTPSQSMRDAVRPVAPGTPPRSPAESMRQAVRPVTPSGPGMRAPGIAGGLGAAVTLGGMALDAYRNRRPSGPYEQGMEPEGTPEATMPEAERNPPMPQVSGRSYDIGEGGTLQPAPTPRSSAPARPAARPAPRPAPRASSAADDLNAIVLKLQRGEAPANETERRLADRMGIAYRKGGMVKPKGHGMKEEAMEMKGGRYRGGAKEERAEMMMKKGGAVKPKAPAKKMKSGGKVAPKKMMKGGMTSKPKKMMGGGKAMYAKGGMAKGCK